MKIEVIEIQELKEGGADLILEIDEEYKEFIKATLKWEEWSDSKFSEFVIETISNYCQSPLEKK